MLCQSKRLNLMIARHVPNTQRFLLLKRSLLLTTMSILASLWIDINYSIFSKDHFDFTASEKNFYYQIIQSSVKSSLKMNLKRLDNKISKLFN